MKFLPLLYGVPRGSVLGPLLIQLYTADVAKIADEHTVPFHAYADETQLYTSWSPPDWSFAVDCLLRCISDVDRWILSNRVNLNADKMTINLVESAQMLQKVSSVPLSVGGVESVLLNSVHALGTRYTLS